MSLRQILGKIGLWFAADELVGYASADHAWVVGP